MELMLLFAKLLVVCDQYWLCHVVFYYSQKALLRFELRISCLLDRRFNQLSHGALVCILQMV